MLIYWTVIAVATICCVLAAIILAVDFIHTTEEPLIEQKRKRWH